MVPLDWLAAVVPLDWLAALDRFSIPVGATDEQVSVALTRHGLDWWFRHTTHTDVIGNEVHYWVAKVAAGEDRSHSPSDWADDVATPCFGRSSSCRDEALGEALAQWFQRSDGRPPHQK